MLCGSVCTQIHGYILAISHINTHTLAHTHTHTHTHSHPPTHPRTHTYAPSLSYYFSTLRLGPMVDSTPVPQYSNLPARVQNFIGRNADMCMVIELVTTQRLVTIRGPPVWFCVCVCMCVCVCTCVFVCLVFFCC